MSATISVTKPSADVIVIGGGVIGLSIAWQLAVHGAFVRILEQGQFGQEASWAGAGILPPGNPERARTPEARLRAASHVMWPEWTEQLRASTGIDNGYTRCGGLEIRTEESKSELNKDISTWQAEGVTVETLEFGDLRHRFPALHPDMTSGYVLPELCQVRNPRHLKSLISACALGGVDLRAGCPVTGFDRVQNRIHSVWAGGEAHHAAEFVVSGGAWSHSLLQQAGQNLAVEPIRGQIVLLETRPLPFRCVIQQGARYLVPRADGRILIGSTEEHAGFDKRNTAEAVAGLIDFACSLVPGLAEARFERCWSGLRPHISGGLPFIGRCPGIDNLSVATGHYRAGLQLSPITAAIVCQMILSSDRGLASTRNSNAVTDAGLIDALSTW